MQRLLQSNRTPVAAPASNTAADALRAQPEKFRLAPDALLLDPFRVDFFAPDHHSLPALTVGSRCLLYNTFQFEATTGSAQIGARCFSLPTTVVRLGPAPANGEPNLILGDDVFLSARWVYDNNGHSYDIHRRVQDLLQAEDDFLAVGSSAINKDWSGVKMAPIHIEDHVWVGQNAVILKGVTIGKGAIIGAFSVVTRDVEPWTVVAGNPARVVRSLSPQC